MDEVDNLALHYAMLEYLYDNHKLGMSCFSSAWEDFGREYEIYKEIPPMELKTIFWTEIAQNIGEQPEKYFLLTEKQLEYFDPEDFPLEHNNELIQTILENNEPKANVDFTFYRSTSAYGNSGVDQTIRQQTPNERMETIKKAFANPTLYNSVFDDEVREVDEEDTKINIIAQKPTMEVDMGEDPLEIFKDMLLTLDDIEAGKTELTDDEVFERLAADNFDMDFNDLPEGLQYYLKQFGDTVFYKQPELPTLAISSSPHVVTSTPLVNDSQNRPSFRNLRSASISEISKERRSLFQKLESNKIPSKRYARSNILFPSLSDTSLSTTKN